MTDEPLSPARLDEIEHQAKSALAESIIEQAWGRRALELVREVRRLRDEEAAIGEVVLRSVTAIRLSATMLRNAGVESEDVRAGEEKALELERFARDIGWIKKD